MQDAITYFPSRIFVINESGEKRKRVTGRFFRRSVGRPLGGRKNAREIARRSSEVAVNLTCHTLSSFFLVFLRWRGLEKKGTPTLDGRVTPHSCTRSR